MKKHLRPAHVIWLCGVAAALLLGAVSAPVDQQATYFAATLAEAQAASANWKDGSVCYVASSNRRYMAISGALQDLPSVDDYAVLSEEPIQATATADTSTASASYVDMDSMTATLTSDGTWEIAFSASGDNSLTSVSSDYIIQHAGADLQHTERTITTSDTESLSTRAIVAGALNDVVKVRFRATGVAHTCVIHERSLSAVRIR